MKLRAAVLLGLLAAGQAWAREADLLSLDLEQLMQIRVTAVSKREDSVALAPGVVTVLNAERIRELGARNLTEALAHVPGLFAFTNYFSVVDQLSIRGDLSDNVSNKLLFLINGHPSYLSLDGAPFTDMVPIEAVERIEVVRGPASVLYGTNALTGVINVVTKRDLGEYSGTASLRAGSFGTRAGNVQLAQSVGGWELFVTAAAQQQDGYLQGIRADQDMILGAPGQNRQSEEHTKLFMQARRGGLEIDIAFLEQDRTSKYGILPSLLFPMTRPIHVENFGIDVRYRQPLAEGHELNYVLRYDDFHNDYAVANYQILQGEPEAAPRVGVGAWQGRKYGMEVFLSSSFERGDLTVGALWDEYRGDPVIFNTGVSAPFELIPEASSNRDIAAYANGRYHWSERTTLVSGLRYTDNRITGSHLDYRFGMVWQLPADISLKALYGTAYRSPTFDELNTDAAPVIRGNPDLGFEEIEGLDISLSRSTRHFNVTLNYFANRTDNAIATRPAADGIETYTNIPGIRTQGIEWDFGWSPNSSLRAYLHGFHLIDVEDIETGRSLRGETVSRAHGAGLTWNANTHLQFNLSYLYNGDWLNSEGFGLWNAAIYYRPTWAAANVELFLLLHNASDRQYTHPEWQSRVIDTIPGGPPRSLETGIRLSW